MTTQLEALHRVRANHALANDSDWEATVYRTADIEAILCLLDERDQLLNFVKEDLRDLREVLAVNENDLGVTAMIESTLILLTEGDSA